MFMVEKGRPEGWRNTRWVIGTLHHLEADREKNFYIFTTRREREYFKQVGDRW